MMAIDRPRLVEGCALLAIPTSKFDRQSPPPMACQWSRAMIPMVRVLLDVMLPRHDGARDVPPDP